MIEDKLSKDERVRLEALAQANMTYQMKSPSADVVLDTAERYREYIENGRK